MYIMFEFSSSPREGRMALGAPHLITAVDFKDTSVTLGARLGIFGQEFGGFDVVRVTGMGFCSCFDDVAFGTGFYLAETTFPIRRQETAAFLGRTSPDEMSDGFPTGSSMIINPSQDIL